MVFFQACVQSIEDKYQNDNISFTGGGFLMYFVCLVIVKLVQITNSRVRAQNEDAKSLFATKRHKILQFLSTLLTSHTTSLAIYRFINWFKKFGEAATSIDRMRWISDNLVAFA